MKAKFILLQKTCWIETEICCWQSWDEIWFHCFWWVQLVVGNVIVIGNCVPFLQVCIYKMIHIISQIKSSHNTIGDTISLSTANNHTFHGRCPPTPHATMPFDTGSHCLTNFQHISMYFMTICLTAILCHCHLKAVATAQGVHAT